MSVSRAPLSFGPPLRMEVIVAAAFTLCVALGGMFLVSTAELSLGADGRPLPLLSGDWFAGLSVANVLLVLALAFGFRRALRASVGLRRAQVAGLVAALATLCTLQVGLVLAAGIHRSL